MENQNLVHPEDDYYDDFVEEVSPRTNYGDMYYEDSGQITKEVAIKFADWIWKNCDEEYIASHTWKSIFDEFLKSNVI